MVKKASKKSVRKAPKKKASATKKTSAKRKVPAKKTAKKKTPAKKKAPAKRKAPAKKAPAGKKAPAKKAPAGKKAPAKKAGEVVLLSGGNPQIPKGYGDEPVQAYISAMPGWKHDVGRRLDDLIVRTVPDVYKAVKWNSPFYGFEDEGWFLNLHCYTNYVQVAFFRGTSLHPEPPGASKHPEVRYLNIREDDFDEEQFVDWVKQASALPGEKM